MKNNNLKREVICEEEPRAVAKLVVVKDVARRPAGAVGAVQEPETIAEKLGLDPDQILEELEERQGDRNVLLAFSLGKDSIALWLYLREKGFNCIPFYCELIPDLEFVNESIDYFERFFGTKIIKVTHPSFWRMLDAATFQPPHRLSVINKFSPPIYDYTALRKAIIEDYGERLGLTEKHYYGVGIRAVDSPNRWSSIKQRGAFNHKEKKVYPVCWMRKREVIEIIDKHGVKLPVDYELFGRSFDGIDKRFLAPIKDRFPEDYQKILYWFPLAELELLR